MLLKLRLKLFSNIPLVKLCSKPFLIDFLLKQCVKLFSKINVVETISEAIVKHLFC